MLLQSDQSSINGTQLKRLKLTFKDDPTPKVKMTKVSEWEFDVLEMTLVIICPI